MENKLENKYKKHLFYSIRQGGKKQVCPFGVLVGCVGTGKTTVFNKITNQDQETSDRGSSTTRMSFGCYSGYGNNFKIIDTPGTSAEEDKLSHALQLRSALIEGPINRIFLLLKKDRVGVMQKQLAEQIFTLQEWKPIITVVVTHWDFEDTQKDRAEFEYYKKKLLDYEMDLENSFIFVGKDSDPNEVCDAFYRCMCLNDPQNLEINTEDFKSKFDIFENMNSIIREQVNLFQEITSQVITEMSNYNESDKDEFLHSCIVNINDLAEQTLQEFRTTYNQKMDEIQTYMHILELKQKFTPLVEKIRQVAQKDMSFDLLNKQDPRNMFKQCPHCGQIWVKVEGCEGQTSCGNRVAKNDIFTAERKFMKFKFSLKNKKFTWSKLQGDAKTVKQNFYKTENKGRGCGRQFIWSNAPLVSHDTLKQLQDAGIADFKVDNEKEKGDFNMNLEFLFKVSGSIPYFDGFTPFFY